MQFQSPQIQSCIVIENWTLRHVSYWYIFLINLSCFVSLGPDVPYLAIARRQTIEIVPADQGRRDSGVEAKSIRNLDMKSIVGVGVHVASNRLFWGDSSHNKIYSINMETQQDLKEVSTIACNSYYIMIY